MHEIKGWHGVGAVSCGLLKKYDFGLTTWLSTFNCALVTFGWGSDQSCPTWGDRRNGPGRFQDSFQVPTNHWPEYCLESGSIVAVCPRFLLGVVAWGSGSSGSRPLTSTQRIWRQTTPAQAGRRGRLVKVHSQTMTRDCGEVAFDLGLPV